MEQENRAAIVNEFAYHLHDTLVLLGAKVEIARLLLSLRAIEQADIDALRQYNIDLQAAVKDRLAALNTIQVRVAQR